MFSAIPCVSFSVFSPSALISTSTYILFPNFLVFTSSILFTPVCLFIILYILFTVSSSHASSVSSLIVCINISSPAFIINTDITTLAIESNTKRPSLAPSIPNKASELMKVHQIYDAKHLP